MRSRKLITLLVIAGVIFLTGAVMPVSAATLYVKGDNTGAHLAASTQWTYPNEAFKANTFNAFGVKATLAGGQIQYVPDSNVNNQNVVFTLSNSALFQAANTNDVYMLYDSSAGIKRASSQNGTALVAQVGTTTLQFPAVSLVQNHTYYLVSSGTATNHTLNLTTPSGAAAQSLTLSVAQAITYNQGSTSALQYANYWNPTVTAGLADAVIDVASGRKLFTNSAATDSVTATFAPKGTTIFVDFIGSAANTATDAFITINTLNAFNSLSFSLGVQDNTGIQKVEWIYTGGAAEQLTYDSVNKKYSKTITTAAKPANADTGEFKITVDGTTVLNTRNFTYSISSTANTGYSNTTYLNDTAAGSWTLNGYQAVCPYVNTNTLYGTQFVISNTGSSSADVFWDTVASSSSTVNANLANYSNKQVSGKTAIPARTTAVFNADEVISALGLPTQEAGNYLRNQVRVTVTASPSMVNGMAIQADGGTTKRSEPLYVRPTVGANQMDYGIE